MDLYETDDEIVVEIDLPGMDPLGIVLQILDNRLILEGKRKHLPETGHYLRMERCFEDFRRVVRLPGAVRPERVQARYERGVVRLRMPKIEDRRRRAVRIEIK
jgi:HSP20 family protein